MIEKEKIQVLLAQTARTLFSQTRLELRKEGMDATVEQSRILAYLWFKDGQSQQDLSVCVDRDKTTLTRVLSNMEKNNLIVRITDQADKRSRLVYLTHKGKSLQEKILVIRKKILATAFANCSDEEITNLVRVLKKVQHAFE